MKNKKVVIVGGGAAGMLAAIAAAKAGADVVLLEKNEKLGKKIYITGKGRCNLTNACDRDEMFDSFYKNSKFMYSSYAAFNNYDIMTLVSDNGCPLDIQRGNRVFPRSEKSFDVIKALTRALSETGVDIRLETEFKSLNIRDNICYGTLEPYIEADSVIIATGGLSYPTTGSTGDGMRLAKDLGLAVEKCRPSLVPLNVSEDYIRQLQGLSLKNVRLIISDANNRELFNKQGELLFTHFGISGPLVLTASAYIGSYLSGGNKLKGRIDLKPALSLQQLDARILRDFQECINKSFANSLNKLLPRTLIPIIIRLSGIAPDKKLNSVSAAERLELAELLKNFPFTIEGLRGYNEAVITDGGVSVRELNPKTMEAKKIGGLYFAGEVIDVSAVTGGFNLQLAFSTGYAAGIGAAGR